jgi:hypothetical protein
MPEKCKFLNKWLEHPQYHDWLRNSPDIHKAHCKCCNKSFDIIFNLEHKWTRLMLCPLRNTFRKTHESSWKPIKTTSLKPGDEISLMRIFYLSGKIPENTVL